MNQPGKAIALEGEVLPALSPSQTGKLEKQAQQHYGRAQMGVVLFAADLARLQNGNAHKVRGYGQFGKYAEAMFEGISSSNAQQIVRQGIVLLKLEETGRLELNEREQNLPGTTGLRELSVVAKRFGEDVMLQAWDEAVKSGRKVTSETVLAALGTFIQIEADPMHPEIAEKSQEEELEEDTEPELPEKMQELVERIRDLSWGLPETLGEVRDATEQLEREVKGLGTKADQKWIDSKR